MSHKSAQYVASVLDWLDNLGHTLVFGVCLVALVAMLCGWPS